MTHKIETTPKSSDTGGKTKTSPPSNDENNIL